MKQYEKPQMEIIIIKTNISTGCNDKSETCNDSHPCYTEIAGSNP